MRTIHKQTLAIDLVQTLSVPAGAVFRAVQRQHNDAVIWYECDPNADPEPRQVVMVPTGFPMPDVSKLEYLGTVQLAEGDFVGHFYEAIK